MVTIDEGHQRLRIGGVDHISAERVLTIPLSSGGISRDRTGVGPVLYPERLGSVYGLFEDQTVVARKRGQDGAGEIKIPFRANNTHRRSSRVRYRAAQPRCDDHPISAVPRTLARSDLTAILPPLVANRNGAAIDLLVTGPLDDEMVVVGEQTDLSAAGKFSSERDDDHRSRL